MQGITHWGVAVDIAAQGARVVAPPHRSLLGDQPDDTARTGTDLGKGCEAWIVLIVACIAQDNHGGTLINTAEIVTTEFA